MANTLHVKKGDRVRVITGSDKGKIGEVLKVDLERQRVVVSGVNIVSATRGTARLSRSPVRSSRAASSPPRPPSTSPT